MFQTTLIIILYRFFLITFVIETIWLIVRAVKRYKALPVADKSLSIDSLCDKTPNPENGKLSFFIKLVVTFALWFLFSLYLFAADLFASVGDKVGNEPLVTADSGTLGLIAIYILWFLVGLLLIYWIGKTSKQPAKLPQEQVAGISELTISAQLEKRHISAEESGRLIRFLIDSASNTVEMIKKIDD